MLISAAANNIKIMNAVRKSWRDAASMIILTKRSAEVQSRVGNRDSVNYEILLQTRTDSGSFANSVVFPGGVAEAADGSERWHQLFKSFGYTQNDFDSFYCTGGTPAPLFESNPILRHISLRITAIRETFEELGILLCSQQNKKDRDGIWANIFSDFDVKPWQDRISKNPEELWTLCKEYNCYPDIWSLYYWSSWLTPATYEKRFNTAFFVTGLESKPAYVQGNAEVKSVEWLSPTEVLDKPNVLLYPPQIYELNRLACVKDLTELVHFAKKRSCHSDEFIYPFSLKLKDGSALILHGDDLYPESLNYNDNNSKYIDKTILELRENCVTLHRLEIYKSQGKPKRLFVIKNYKSCNHINMGDLVFQFN